MIHAYKLGGFGIIIDAASGSIHSVDDAAFDAILAYEKEGGEGAAKCVGERYKNLGKSDIIELISDIEDLERRGKLFSADAFTGVDLSRRETPLKALCMNVSHLCNMRCIYCFAGSGEYSGGGLMPLETGKRAIDFLVDNSGGSKYLDVDFFGGEPLLNWNVIKGIVNYAREKESGTGKKFRFTLTTNGLLIDDDVIDFTCREMLNVVLSLDGRREINDASRIPNDGGGCYSAVVPKIKKLVEARNGKGYYIRGTYTRGNLDFVNDILHIADLGFTELSMEPVVAKPGAAYALTADDLPKLCEQYELLAMEMLKRENEGRGFTFYHYKLDPEGGPCIYKRAAGCGVGSGYLAVTPGGELYPCHQFVGDEGFLMGDVWRGIANEQLRGKFCGCGIYSRDKCRECWARLYCSGGCAANAYHDSGSIEGVYELGCELFKKRLECAIMINIVHYSGVSPGS